MLQRQRQKGADYKFREGPGRPLISLSTDVAAAGASSPRKEGGGSPSHSPAKKADASGGEGGGGGGGGSALDAYDPKEVAQRELRDLTETVRGQGGCGVLWAGGGCGAPNPHPPSPPSPCTMGCWPSPLPPRRSPPATYPPPPPPLFSSTHHLLPGVQNARRGVHAGGRVQGA